MLTSYGFWLHVFAALGLFALGSVMVGLFFAIGRRPRQIVATSTPPLDSHEFLAALAGAVNGTVQRGGTAELLDNGDAFFPAMLEAIANARRSVNFSVYIWEPGEVSDRFFAALTGRASEGVQVRVMLDGLGGIRAPSEGIDALRAAGGKVERFRPPRFGMLTRFHKRNHRRAIIIDGRIGFTGGAAIGDKWLGDVRTPEEWRDSMVRVTGCLAQELQSAFAEPWAYCCGEILAGPDFYPALENEETEDDNAPRHIGLISSPSSEEHPLRLFYMLSLLCARERIWVTTPYFVPDGPTLQALIRRARDGLDVRLLLPNEHTDATPIRLAAHANYDNLLEAGVRIFEYQPSFNHCKSMVLDGKWSIIGSANLDIRSKELNEENVIGLLDRSFARLLEESFSKDLEKSEEIRLETWRRRGVFARWVERVARLFAEQY